MAHIKKLRVSAIGKRSESLQFGWTRYDVTFTTFTDDNGNKRYFVGEKEVTKDDGNAQYTELKQSNAKWRTTVDAELFLERQNKQWKKHKNADTKREWYVLTAEESFKQTVEEYDVSYEELIEKFNNSIDQYVEYIDDGAQYRAACARNRELRDYIDKLNELIAERKN